MSRRHSQYFNPMKPVTTNRPLKLLPLLLVFSGLLASMGGCNGSARGAHHANAPTLAGGDGPVRRNVADPNAPFLLKPTEPRLAKRDPLLDVNGVAPCAPEQLSVFESRARVSGLRHTLRMSLRNEGEACRLSGYPSITLLDQEGRVVENVVTQRLSADAMTASLVDGNPVTALPSADPLVVDAPSRQVLIPEAGEAAFELGWTDGPACTAVSRIAVGAPGSANVTAPPILINRPLRICDGALRITALAPEAEAQ